MGSMASAGAPWKARTRKHPQDLAARMGRKLASVGLGITVLEQIRVATPGGRAGGWIDVGLRVVGGTLMDCLKCQPVGSRGKGK